MEEKDNRQQREEIYSIVVRAGKRTYFFDVKETRKKEKYLTITESKRRFNDESGKFFYEKHKLFLYQEDFDKFADGLSGVIEYIRNNQGPGDQAHEETPPAGVEETQRDFAQQADESKTGEADILDKSKDPDMPGEDSDPDKEEDKF